MADNRQEWGEFVETTSKKLPEQQAKAVRDFWAAVSTTNPVLPLPHIEYGEGTDAGGGKTVRFSWSRSGYFLDVELWSDGLCEWFETSRTPSGRLTAGTPDKREPVPTEDLLQRMHGHFSG